ncbi:hypothetical protein C1H46_027662 [Malus baccata]|uniref:TIR domain-containing protein n=1 Tax=Malus baccata TaxID=106549 RepID=A0A540LKD8_MALBA|nr:hypothetical protein C1H46_027662 [Malus baccata]
MDTGTVLEASPSSSPSSSSSTTSSSSPYDVFLSFGEDTRKTFTDHLYWTMKDAGIDFFMEENESIRRGENISDKVKQIIQGSKVSVIVFSSRYADSIWCLEELVQIMECRRTLKQMVLPIFYDLSPSDVIATSVLAFQKHRERFHEDTDIQEKLLRWTDALTAAAGLTDWTEALTASPGSTVRVFRTTNGNLRCRRETILSLIRGLLLDNQSTTLQILTLRKVGKGLHKWIILIQDLLDFFNHISV